MARRTLIDIDNKIIEQTIKEGATHGVDNVSVLAVARKCGITDACVFKHFGTKDNLIITSFKKVNEEIIRGMCKTVILGDNRSYRALIEYLVEVEDFTKFMSSYGHSKYDKCEVNEETKPLVEFCRYTLSSKLQLKSDEQYLFVWYFIVDMFLHFSCKIIDGTIKLSDENVELISKVLNNYLNKQVKGIALKDLENIDKIESNIGKKFAFIAAKFSKNKKS